MTGKIKVIFTKDLGGFVSIEDDIIIEGLTCYKDGEAVGKVIEVNPIDDAVEATIRIDSPTLVEELMEMIDIEF